MRPPKNDDGSYKGQLRTVSIRAEIDIIPNRDKTAETHPGGGPAHDPRVARRVTSDSVAARVAYVSLSLAAPEFGPRKLYANLGRAACQDDDSVFAPI
jgi:uncharacterized protein (DUF736 family)